MPEKAVSTASAQHPTRYFAPSDPTVARFSAISVQRYEYAGGQINQIGVDLGGWIKQQRQPKMSP
jgi:hypothetical protein